MTGSVAAGAESAATPSARDQNDHSSVGNGGVARGGEKGGKEQGNEEVNWIGRKGVNLKTVTIMHTREGGKLWIASVGGLRVHGRHMECTLRLCSQICSRPLDSSRPWYKLIAFTLLATQDPLLYP